MLIQNIHEMKENVMKTQLICILAHMKKDKIKFSYLNLLNS